MLESIFNEELTLGSLFIVLIIGIILGVIISMIHKFTGSYSKNFLITLSILPLLVSTVIIMVNGNLGTSVAIVGAFSLVRFRSLPGNSKEILSVFFAMAIGLSLGMGHVIFASIITIVVSVLLIIFDRIKLYNEENIKKLTIIIPENLSFDNLFDDTFEKYGVKANLNKIKTTNLGSMIELTYYMTYTKAIKEKELIDDLRIKNGNLKISLNNGIDEREL